MTGSGTQADPYLIYNVTDLQNMKNNLDAYYELANDIDASETSGWNGGQGFEPIGTEASPFTGHFDGKGHSITSLHINRVQFVGLFGYTRMANIRRVAINSCYIRGYHSVGALAGYCLATTISRCSSSGQIVMVGGGFDHIASGGAGGLIGRITTDSVGSAVAERCFSTANLSCEAGAIWNIGGLIGYLDGVSGASGAAAENCYARGNVLGHSDTYNAGGFFGNFGSTFCSVVNCYSTGHVTGHEDATYRYYYGSGSAYLAQIDTFVKNNFWDEETAAVGEKPSHHGDVPTPKTTAEMKTKSTFTNAGWDFDTIWDILPAVNDGYPFLYTPPTVATLPATNIEETTATLNGRIVETVQNCVRRGFEWGLDISYGNYCVESGSFGVGDFSHAISGLSPGTPYHFRAFATTKEAA